MADTRTQLDKYRSRWSALDLEFSAYRTHGKEISEYILPRSGRFFSTDRSKDRGFNSIYDNTGTRALRVLGAGLMGGATSPARPWFRLATPDPDLMKYAPVKLWLSDVTRDMLNVFQRSNTYRTLHTMYEELGTFGTAATVLMDDFTSVIHHYPLAYGEFRLATNYRNEVNTLGREFEQNVGAVVSEFGYSNCSSTTRNLYDRGEVDKLVTITHIIEPRADRDPRKRDALNMAWKSVYFERGSDGDSVLREGGFKQFRALCPRWSANAGEAYANTCPGMEALGDIKQLQHEQLRKAEGIDYMTRPPLQVPTGAKNRELDRFPGGVSYIDSSGPGGGVKSMFDVNLRLDHLLADIQDVRGRIKETFYSDLFLMLANQSNSRMTATEVAERHEEKLLMLGPVLERLHNELLDPLVNMTFARMIEAGVVPPPPEELQGQNLNVEFISMLAQAQRAVSTNSVDRFVGNLGAIAAFKPEIVDKFDADQWADVYSDMLGVDPELVVPDDQVALVRKQRAQAQQAAQMSAMAEQGANTASKLAAADTEGKNALTDITRAYSGYT